MSAHTDLIKEKLNILDVVASYVKLEKAGRTYKGKSPFSHEKTPSFFVSPEKGFFYCFSSGKGGDIFNFIQEIERVEFGEALKMLADRAGVDLGSINLGAEKAKKRLYTLLDDAAKWYEVNLRKNKDVVDYLLKRGLTKETIITFRIGYAKDSWRDMYDYLKHKKYSDQEIMQAGLISSKKGGGFFDKFRSRVMFPLFDGRGRIVGFSGRIFGNNDDVAKYMNSPEGPIFDKSKVLYGYHTAKPAMSKENACILVEGQFDVLMSQQSGHTNTVAISGTGLTDGHIKMIHRFADTAVLALDSDKAGVKATRRSVIAAYKAGMQVKVAVLDQGQDPADCISHTPDAWAVALADAHDYIEYRMKIAARSDMSFEQKMQLVTSDLFEFVSFIKSAVFQDSMIQKIALFLGVNVDAVRKDFAGYDPETTLDHVVAANESTIPQQKYNLKQQITGMVQYIHDRDLDIGPENENIFTEVFGKNTREYTSQEEQVDIDIQSFVLAERYQNHDEASLQKVLFELLRSYEMRMIETELASIDAAIKLEQLKNPNSFTERLKELTKKSTMVLAKKVEKEQSKQ